MLCFGSDESTVIGFAYVQLGGKKCEVYLSHFQNGRSFITIIVSVKEINLPGYAAPSLVCVSICMLFYHTKCISYTDANIPFRCILRLENPFI